MGQDHQGALKKTVLREGCRRLTLGFRIFGPVGPHRVTEVELTLGPAQRPHNNPKVQVAATKYKQLPLLIAKTT